MSENKKEKCVDCGLGPIKDDTCKACGLTGQKEERERKEIFDREWKTCKHCGVKDGEKKSNWVINGCCRKCDQRIDCEYDFKRAQEHGSVTRDDSIMCPYCGYVEDQDIYEYHENKSFDCPECEKTSEMNIEYTANITTTKIGGKND